MWLCLKAIIQSNMLIFIMLTQGNKIAKVCQNFSSDVAAVLRNILVFQVKNLN